MSINLYETTTKEIYTAGGGALLEGVRYDFEINELNLRKNVVSFDRRVPDKLKGKDYDELTPDQKKQIDALDLGTTKGGQKKSPIADKINVSVKETSTGRDFFYDVEFILFGGRYGTPFLDFVRKVTGEIIEQNDEVDIVQVLPRGTVFSAELVRRGKGNFLHINMDSVGPSIEMAAYDALSSNAKTVLADLKPFNGKTKGEILAYIEAGQVGGSMPVEDAKNALGELEGTYIIDDVLKL